MCEDEKEVCDLVIEASKSILEFEVCGIDFEENGQFIPISFSSKIEGGFIRRDVEEAGISRKVFRDKESLLVKDSREVDFSKPVVSDYRSSITIPMGDFGFFQALSTEIGRFDEEDLELAEIMVDHATEAIKRIRSEEDLKANKAKIERLYKTSAELESCQSEEDVWDYAVKAAEKILDFDMCCFDAVEEDEFVLKAKSSEVAQGAYYDRKPIEEANTSKRTYLNQKSYLINDLKDDKKADPADSDYRSLISVPVGKYGTFQAVSTEKGHFDQSDLKMTQLLISHVSEALKRLETEGREDFLHSLLRHDVSNKNQIVKGYLQLIRDHDIPEEAKDFVDGAEHAVDDSIQIVEKVRKLRTLRKEDERSEVDLNAILDRVLSIKKAQLEKECIEIEIEKPNCKVRGGPLMEELFSNLIENSIQHSDCEKIMISSNMKDDKCVVIIEDDGKGIPDDVKEKIFERGFKEGENAGTGLGLYMVNEIAENYGGSVEVKDSELGGARFDVKLILED